MRPAIDVRVSNEYHMGIALPLVDASISKASSKYNYLIILKCEVSFKCANTTLGFKLDIGRTAQRMAAVNELWNTWKET